MAPAFVFLDTSVSLIASTGEKASHGMNMLSYFKLFTPEEPSGGGSTRPFFDPSKWQLEDSDGESEEEGGVLVDWVREGTVRLVADGLVDPPEISTVSIQLPAEPREIFHLVEYVRVTTADRKVIVLSTGPKLHDYGSSGHYLVHDAAAGALFLSPHVDWDELSEHFGCGGPVVTRRGEASGDFVLAMVLRSWRTERLSLFLWSPSSTGPQQWARHDVRLPEGVPEFGFKTDVAFAFGGRWACWADLNLGIVACDVLSPDPELHMVPLPEGCARDPYVMYRGRVKDYGTMACVGGEIKLVHMDGFDDDECPRDEITISTWTLLRQEPSCPSRWRWRRDDGRVLRVGDLWVDESFLAVPGLPRRAPTCPVLSPDEPDVVYFFMSDLGYDVDGHIVTRGEYVLALNMQSKKIQTWTKCPTGRSFELTPSFIAIDRCAFL
ncbi:unnamed protein product [Urochloa decumbens]|uniref:DUF1618 domain-containing protein n=1 Tax=Urochloa decumbens TaxID=240449 RepID=A0ABC8XRX4_9POAL